MTVTGGTIDNELDIRHLIKGAYIVKVFTADGSRTEKFVKD